MTIYEKKSAMPSTDPAGRELDTTIAQLFGELFESAPVIERSKLLEPLLRPVGVLSLAPVANGIFARILFRSGWENLQDHLDDLRNVRASDVVALVRHMQRYSVTVMDGWAQMLLASPLLACSGAATALLTALVQRARARANGAAVAGFHPASTGRIRSSHQALHC